MAAWSSLLNSRAHQTLSCELLWLVNDLHENNISNKTIPPDCYICDRSWSQQQPQQKRRLLLCWRYVCVWSREQDSRAQAEQMSEQIYTRCWFIYQHFPGLSPLTHSIQFWIFIPLCLCPVSQTHVNFPFCCCSHLHLIYLWIVLAAALCTSEAAAMITGVLSAGAQAITKRQEVSVFTNDSQELRASNSITHNLSWVSCDGVPTFEKETSEVFHEGNLGYDTLM